MADSKDTQRSRFPLAAYNFRVTLAGQTASFSEVSGLKVEYESETYRHGLSFSEGEALALLPSFKFFPVTMKRGIIQGLTTLSDWVASGEMRTIDVSLCDETSTPVVTWHIGRAVPVKLEAPTLSASGNDAAIESLEVMVSRVSLEHH